MSLVRHGGRLLWMWCPGCEDTHCVRINQPGSWTWDGSETAPTVEPSILVTGVQWPHEYSFHDKNHHVAPGEPTICHSFVRAGQWEFLADCTHELAGQTVPMVPLPEWMNAEYTA